jgi:hypothetical protein
MKTLTSSSSGGECRNPNFGLATKAKGLQGCKLRGSPGAKVKSLQGCGPRGSPGVTSHTPGNVRKCEGVWRNEHSHSQGNSHFRRWSPDRFLKLKRMISGVKIQWLVVFFISLEKLLECKCLKWDYIAHSDIWNRSYLQKKGWESICQFDALLGPEVNPLEGSPNVKLRKLGPKGTLPASNFRKG